MLAIARWRARLIAGIRVPTLAVQRQVSGQSVEHWEYDSFVRNHEWRLALEVELYGSVDERRFNLGRASAASARQVQHRGPQSYGSSRAPHRTLTNGSWVTDHTSILVPCVRHRGETRPRTEHMLL